jgi:hypothetical protein
VAQQEKSSTTMQRYLMDLGIPLKDFASFVGSCSERVRAAATGMVES